MVIVPQRKEGVKSVSLKNLVFQDSGMLKKSRALTRKARYTVDQHFVCRASQKLFYLLIQTTLNKEDKII
jgi:predicted rRNA methylase YqxC with S4 and FtsJ domains